MKARAPFYEFEIYRVGYTYAIFRKQLSEHEVPRETGTKGIWSFKTVEKPRFAYGGLYLYFTHLLCKDKLEIKTYKGQGSWKQTGLVLQTNYIVYRRKSSKILLWLLETSNFWLLGYDTWVKFKRMNLCALYIKWSPTDKESQITNRTKLQVKKKKRLI